jgi:bifunctional enzyme CysN/CysC
MPDSLLRVLTCGSVDDGKSTLIGRLLFECGGIPDDVQAALARDSARFGTTGGIDYALLVDGLAAEREQGITIDVAYRYFDSGTRRFILADTPGHVQYTRNMVTGASTADLAVLLVDARAGLLQQTRRHAAIAAMLGIRQIVLAVNKMDLVGFDSARFDRIAAEFNAFAPRLGPITVTAIPVCARDGDNVTSPSSRMDWYSGPCVLAALESATPAVPDAAAPARLPIQYVSRPDAGFRGFAGTIAAGTLRPGDSVANATSGASARIARLIAMGGDLAEAPAGTPVMLTLEPEIDISRGDLLTAGTAPPMAGQILADIAWFADTPLFRGRSYLLALGPATRIATVSRILHRLDVDALAPVPASQLCLNDIGRVSLSLNAPIAYEPYAANRSLGSCILIDRVTRATLGAGLIEGTDAAAGEVVWHREDVDKPARAALKGQRPAVLWFTGLSGAGKSTIANLVERRLHTLGYHTAILDGDNVRHGLNRDLGFSEADRVENIRRVAEVSRLFVEAGLIVLVSFISPYRTERLLARERVEAGEFVEIYVDTPVDECRRRDPKGLYARADAGTLRNFTGVSAPYEAPENAEIHLRTLGTRAEDLAEIVVADLRRRGVVG